MNILIITPFYKHDRNIASVRWTNIGIRLAKKHNVIVVTQPHDDMDMKMTVEKDEDNILVARINQKTWYEKTAVKHFGGATGDDWQTVAGTDEPKQVQDGFKRKLKNKVLYASMRHKAKQYADSIIKNVIPKDMTIDVVISSACPFIEMLFGYEIKKRLNCKWISDFRDLPFIEDNCDGTHIQKELMKEVLPCAETITVVINRMKSHLLETIPLIQKKRIYVLPNGYSETDRFEESFSEKDGKMHIGHTGSLYGIPDTTDMLFDALYRAKQENERLDVVVDCAGGNNQTIIDTAKKYGLNNIVHDYGFVPREQALRLQRHADCLLAIVRNLPGKGFAAKLYEYLLNKKPIILLVLGDGEKCDAEEFVESLNLGFVANEKNREKSIQELKDYLLDQYKRKESGLPLQYKPILENVNRYNHDYIVTEVEMLCKACVEEDWK